MDKKSISKKILFRSYFITLLIYNKKYKMVANFINKIGKENLDDIKFILDSSIIKPSYEKQFIPMDMLISFLDDKDLYQTTVTVTKLIDLAYIMCCFLVTGLVVNFFVIKNIEHLPLFVNMIVSLCSFFGLWGLYLQLPHLLRSAYPVYFLNSELKELSANIIGCESGQMTLYRDLINNLNKILDKEEGIPSVHNWLLDNSFEKRAKDLKAIEDTMQRVRSMLDSSQRVLKNNNLTMVYKAVERDFKFCQDLRGYILVKRSSQNNRSKHKPELLFNVLHTLKNTLLANKDNQTDLKIVTMNYEKLLLKIVEECETKKLYTELFQISFESYSAENLYIFSIFQDITMKKGLTYEIIFQNMKQKHLETSIKVLGYLLNKVDSFLLKTKNESPELFDSLEVRVNILKASIPEGITNRAIELWHEEIV